MVEPNVFLRLLEGMREKDIREKLDQGVWGGPDDTRNRMARNRLQELQRRCEGKDQAEGPGEHVPSDRHARHCGDRWYCLLLAPAVFNAQ